MNQRRRHGAKQRRAQRLAAEHRKQRQTQVVRELARELDAEHDAARAAEEREDGLYWHAQYMKSDRV